MECLGKITFQQYDEFAKPLERVNRAVATSGRLICEISGRKRGVIPTFKTGELGFRPSEKARQRDTI